MNDFIPTISFTDFKKLRPEQLRELKTSEVTFNGDYLFTFVNGNTEPSGYLRTRSQYDGAAANAVSGKAMEELNSEAVPV